ncbi:MAG: hypothetical protein Ta2F_00370 [Termitinemataceae bacterium]|nr:MAG: hypothetical protein Ta2F_00370 [Termitinemataceae bacterium]
MITNANISSIEEYIVDSRGIKQVVIEQLCKTDCPCFIRFGFKAIIDTKTFNQILFCNIIKGVV